jgi:hypothetical protein
VSEGFRLREEEGEEEEFQGFGDYKLGIRGGRRMMKY